MNSIFERNKDIEKFTVNAEMTVADNKIAGAAAGPQSASILSMHGMNMRANTRWINTFATTGSPETSWSSCG